MPLPLVPVAGGMLIAAIVGPVIAREAQRRLGGTRVAILGRPQVGKSTLLHFLAEGHLPDQPERTPDPVPGGQFSLELPGRGRTKFTSKQDLPGHTFPAYKNWRKAYDTSDRVWYLFRSDLVAAGDADEIALIKGHLDHLADWHSELGNKAPSVTLIGVFTDQDPGHDEAALEERVRAAPPISDGAVNLGKAGIVVGNQASEGSATRLVERIVSHL